MKELESERLKYLAKAQESLFYMTDRMEQWESSQSELEKNAYETINLSDKILGLCEAGIKLIGQLQGCYSTALLEEEMILEEAGERKPAAETLQELLSTLNQIGKHSQGINETVHLLEEEVAEQVELVADVQGMVCCTMEQIDSVVACGEFILADL